MAITLILEVTIEGFKSEATEKGNFTARGVTFDVKHAKGCDESPLAMLAPNYGNNGTILFMTKDKGLVAKVNSARAARGSAADEITALRAEIAALKAAKEGKPRGAKKAPTEAELLKAELDALKAAQK
jgi:hypothetical protein